MEEQVDLLMQDAERSETSLQTASSEALDVATVLEVLGTDVIIFDEKPAGKNGKVKGSVSMSRSLINGSHGLTLNEKRLLMTALRGLDSKKSAWAHNHNGLAGQVTVRVTAEQFAEVAGLNERGTKQSSGAYRGLIDACERLATRRVRYKEGQDIVVIPWVTEARYRVGEAWAQIIFHPKLNPHIFALRDRFVTYPIDYGVGLTSNYSWRLMELIMREKDRGRLLIRLDDFCLALDIPETYKFGDIKRRVIDQSVQELATKKRLLIDWKPKKTGRAVTSLEFTFVHDPQGQLDV